MGRVAADLSGWVEYFCLGVADAFANVRARAAEAASKDQETQLRKLDARQRQVATLFETEPYVTTKQNGTAKKNRKYGLAQET